MNNAIERAEQYHNHFRDAKSDEQRQLLVSDYKAHYVALTDEQKAEANKVHDAYFAKTLLKIDEMEVALQEAKVMLNRQYKQTT
jgi:hypothetical protein